MSALLGIGGYGPFVWAAYGITALAIVVEILMLRGRMRAALAAARAAPLADDDDASDEKNVSRARFTTAGEVR